MEEVGVANYEYLSVYPRLKGGGKRDPNQIIRSKKANEDRLTLSQEVTVFLNKKDETTAENNHLEDDKDEKPDGSELDCLDGE